MVSISLVSGVLALVLGMVILVFPRALNYSVAIYLIIIGLIEIFTAIA